MKLAVAPGAEVPLIPMDPVQNLENTAFFWGGHILEVPCHILVASPRNWVRLIYTILLETFKSLELELRRMFFPHFLASHGDHPHSSTLMKRIRKNGTLNNPLEPFNGLRIQWMDIFGPLNGLIILLKGYLAYPGMVLTLILSYSLVQHMFDSSLFQEEIP